jgi:autotransporter-associated beta strand protein
MMSNSKAFVTLAAAIVLLFAQLRTIRAADTIYQDSFTGTGINLNGTIPDVSLNNNAWLAGANIKDNGTLTGGVFSAMLPFQPQPDTIYTLSATLNGQSTTANNNQWVGLGFTQLQPTLTARWLETGQPVAWAMSRTNTANMTDSSFLGFAASPGAATGGGAASTTTSADSIIITLDTSTPDWTWTVDFNGDGVDRTTTLPVTPNINYVGLTVSGTMANTSTVDDFLLTKVEIPSNEWNVDGGGNFGDTANWTMGVPTVGSKVLFGDVLTSANAPAVVTLNTAASLNQVRFANSASYLLQGPATLTLTGEATVNTFSGSHEIGAQISGVNGLRKVGPGTLVLSNDMNNFTGDITISSGTLEVTTLGAINQASGAVNTAAGSTFQFGGDGAGGGANGTLIEQITGSGTVNLKNDLTTEVIDLGTANPGFTGAVTINGGTLRVSAAGALGSATGVAATGTEVGGGAQSGKLELNNLTVTGERLQIDGRNNDNFAPALSSTGTSRWEGPVAGTTGGNQFNIEAQAGSNLTIAGDIAMPDDTSARTINLLGAGIGRVEGKIIDRTTATGDGAENANVSLVKKGTGTWTIATGTSARDDFHQLGTVVEQGTLIVQGAADAGELWSRTIDIRSGATLDISSFSTYSLQAVEDPDGSLPGSVTGDEIGQELKGSGIVNVGAGTIQGFEDSIISPGDSFGAVNVTTGALNITGNFTYSTFGELGTGRWNFELASTTSPTASDRVLVSGAATINAGDSNDAINLNISPVQGSFAQGAYKLIQASSVSGTAANSNYYIRVRDAQGNDITSGVRQTFNVSNSANSVDLNVAGAAADQNWAGTAGNAWDVNTTDNWTGTGGTKFSHLDNVTFGNVANKNIAVAANVAPGTVTFNGGAGTTYTVTGPGGMTGFAPVNVVSGTVQLQNTGNFYSGTTTIATNARLEMVPATTGTLVANGHLVVTGNTASTLVDDFNDGNISEYTTYTVLDQVATGFPNVGPPDDVVYASTGAAMTANGGQNGSPAAEQALSLRATALGVGQTMVVDTHLNTDTAVFATVGIALADGAVQTDVPTGTANADGRTSYIFNGMRLGEATDSNDARNVKAGGPGTLSPDFNTGNVGVVTNLWIKRISATDFISGYSKDNMATRVTTATHSEIDWDSTAMGFYADIRGVVAPNIGAFDNLRIADGQNNILTVNGDFTLGATGQLDLDIGQDAIDMISASGAALLQGTISVGVNGDFSPFNGETFTLLTAAGGITDAGMNLLLPANFTAQILNSTALVLTYSAALAGDFNFDGKVDAGDYVYWRKNLGDPASYNQWRMNFGSTSGSGNANSPAGVPEPTSFLLLAIAGCTAIMNRRTRQS